MKNVCGAKWTTTSKEFLKLQSLFAAGKTDEASELIDKLLNKAAVQAANMVIGRVVETVQTIEVIEDEEDDD